jgi:MFS family permease
MTFTAVAPVYPQSASRSARLYVIIVLPFAAGYALSYIFRTINALLADRLIADLRLTPAELGFLTSAYFLAMAIVQLPVGMMLDRYGPRRLQSACLLVAALGVCVFATASSLPQLIVGRALIGVGFGTAFLAGLKAIAIWFPTNRIALANGLLLTLGALGAVVATSPAQIFIDALGWRRLLLVLASLTSVTALIIFVVVPERGRPQKLDRCAEPATLAEILSDPLFWRLAPMLATSIGSAWALQALWAAPWLSDVERFDRSVVVQHLTAMALALCVGGIAFGSVIAAGRKRGLGPDVLFGGAVFVFMAAQLAVILRLPVPPVVPWTAIGMAAAAPVLAAAVLSQFYRSEASGKVNAAIGTLQLGFAFAVQWFIGVALDFWPSDQGRHPVEAYQMAFATILSVQALAFAWFIAPALSGRLNTKGPTGERLPRMFLSNAPNSYPNPYLAAQREWSERVANAEIQLQSWRLAALTSLTVCVVLATLVVPK